MAAQKPPSPIALARAHQNWSQAQLAAKLECAVATVSAVERGAVPLNPKMMNRWLDTLNLTGDDRRVIALSVMPAAYVAEVTG